MRRIKRIFIVLVDAITSLFVVTLFFVVMFIVPLYIIVVIINVFQCFM